MQTTSLQFDWRPIKPAVEPKLLCTKCDKEFLESTGLADNRSGWTVCSLKCGNAMNAEHAENCKRGGVGF